VDDQDVRVHPRVPDARLIIFLPAPEWVLDDLQGTWWLEQMSFPNPSHHDFITAQHSVADPALGESDLVVEIGDPDGD
jgi:hypothetical protein